MSVASLRRILARTAAHHAPALLSPLIAAAPLHAQLAGVTPDLPPGVERTFEIHFGNDFLGRGGAIDDFRTQQLGLIAGLGARWSAVVNHSILTLENPERGDPGRIDHLSASVGYRALRRRDSTWTQEIEIGAGLRYASEIGGARMQNGFHQLVGSTLATMPYVDTDRLDGTLWIRAPRRGVFRDREGESVLGKWDLGYWIRASTLLTTDGEWDGSVGAAGVVSRAWFQGWLGVQADWRSGHDRDEVTRETAAFEEGVGVVLGLRFGPLLLETVQELGGDADHGRASLLSTGEPLSALIPRGHVVGLQAGLTVPDVYANLQARWAGCALLGCPPGWRRTLLLDYRFGKPQLGDDVDTYVRTRQISASLEMERAPFAGAPWLTGYASLGGGWREERLEGEGDELQGQRSEAVGSPGLVGDLGFRFSTSAGNGTVDLLLQTGLSGWLPTSGRTVEFAGRTESLQSAQAVLVTGALVRLTLGTR